MNKKALLYLVIGFLCHINMGHATEQNLIPTLSPELNLQIPVFYFDSGTGEVAPMWANLEYVPTDDGYYWFKVADFGSLAQDPNQAGDSNNSNTSQPSNSDGSNTNQPTTSPNEPDKFAGTVEAHNVWRRQVGVADLAWSSEVAKVAQKWANELKSQGCALKHNPDRGNYGENVYWSSGFNPTPKDVVDSWASEISDYNYATNSCKSGKVCGHYTQVVWNTTTEVGCGQASCGSEQVWVCNYNPPGNWVGQKPY